jgi:predicted aspartyl protease
MSSASRGTAVLGPFLVTFALGACSSAPLPQSTPRDLLLQTARQCELENSGVHVWGINQRGQVEFSSRTPEERRRFTACVNERARERIERAKAALAAGRSVPAADGSRQASIPIVVTGNLIRVELIANGSEPLTLLLDTGASRTILRSATATRLGVDPPPNAPRWPTTLADGRVIVVPYTRLRSLGLGSLAVEDIDVGVYDLLPGAPALDGILGGEILGHFRVTIDRQRERLELEIK